MARITLKDSGVVFDKANHTYELNGKMLQGITTMLQRQLFSTEYEGIPWAIVKKAGEYGSQVHASCEDFDKNWNNDGTQEVQDYISICKEYGFTHEASEYTVTDGQTFLKYAFTYFKNAFAFPLKLQQLLEMFLQQFQMFLQLLVQ